MCVCVRVPLQFVIIIMSFKDTPKPYIQY